MLDSYEAERREIHAAVIAEAEANHTLLSNDFWCDELEMAGPEGDAIREAVGARIRTEKTREFHTLGTVLGGCYTVSSCVEYDGAPVRPSDFLTYVPTSDPGCLAPHFWRGDGTSLYDAFGPGFTLVCRPGADERAVCDGAAAAAALGIPLTVVRLEEAEPLALYPECLTLVRPDQHVAARGGRLSRTMLERVTGQRPAPLI